ncbi:hypothetical protein E3N88_03323 [Mikania micrantha]|uniref:Myosin N-terminal SH3-like domain-containing protein n=1 Tax=Mikania micrantha TaxID=192012 RepID=A0A5N6Q8U5_9ASTR|nr:hypothetical protein E3N88_03323 [Mikania micrantha]
MRVVQAHDAYMSGSHDVFPHDGDTVEHIGKTVVVSKPEEFVGVDAVDLGDFVIAVGGKAVEETVEEFDYGESELRRDDGVKVFDFDDINDSFAVMSNSNANMSLHKSSKVWVEDRDTAWVDGEITGFAGKHVQVVTEFGKQILAFAEKLLLRDADADYGGADDMTKLAYLNEPGVLDNLKKRYNHYTSKLK